MTIEAAAIWLKVVHIGAIAAWCATVLYLPGLFAAHAVTTRRPEFFRLRGKTRAAYIGIASPAAVVAVVSGSVLIYVTSATGGWLPLKLTAVGGLVLIHLVCGLMLSRHREQGLAHHPLLLASVVGATAVLIGVILFLVLAKPL